MGKKMLSIHVVMEDERVEFLNKFIKVTGKDKGGDGIKCHAANMRMRGQLFVFFLVRGIGGLHLKACIG